MEEKEINYFVRIEDNDLDGTKSVQIALTGLPGIGMHTKHYEEVLGRKATKDIEKGTPLSWELID